MTQYLIILIFGLTLLCGAQNADELIFEDTFDTAELKEGWEWLREEPKDWRLKDGALEICVRPGDASSVRNALLRKAPDRKEGKFAIEVTITPTLPYTNQFEQAGITWYSGGKPVFKLVRELVDGKLMIIPGRKLLSKPTVQLRLIVTETDYIAQFREDENSDFITAATGKLPPPNNDQVSIQCYHGLFERDNWIRFDNFRILKLNK